MWIKKHDGSLINIEKFDMISIELVANKYRVSAWYGYKSVMLAAYEEEQQAEEAQTAIFCSMRKGDNAMTMPYCITDCGEDV